MEIEKLSFKKVFFKKIKKSIRFFRTAFAITDKKQVLYDFGIL